MSFFKSLTKKQKYIGLSAIALIILIILITTIKSINNSVSNLWFENSFAKESKLLFLNSNAKNAVVSPKNYAVYAFSKEQKDSLWNFYSQNQNLTLSVRVGLKNLKGNAYIKKTASELLFYFGFLSSDDFEKNKLKDNPNRILAGTDLRNFIKNAKGESFFSNGLAFEKNLTKKDIPEGIIIYSEYPIKLYDFFVTVATIGFDLSGEIPFFGLPPNGGNFSLNTKSYNFSGGTLVFPVENSTSSIMPRVELSFLPSENYGDSKDQLKVKLNAGGDLISIRRTKDVKDCVIQTSTLHSPYSNYELTENGELVSKLIMKSNDSSLIPKKANNILYPLKTDPGLILSSKTSSWRSPFFEVYEWDRFPRVLFFDTSNYDIQAQFFRRLAYFAEKKGFRGSILSDEQLGDMHGYNAHDYSAKSLAEFFTKAIEVNAKLNEKEYILRDILVANGLIIPAGYAYREGEGAVISISRESTAALRQSFIAHEAWHGIFFINKDFRNAVAAVYYTIDKNSMDFIKGFWLSQPGLGYDPSDEFLMHNEFMAYIMQQSLYNVAGYFVHCANRGSVSRAMPELCQWVKNTKGVTFEDAGRVLDSYAFDNWGLSCGRVALITR